MSAEIISQTPIAERALSPTERVARLLNNIQGVLNCYQGHGVDARLIGSFGRQASLHTKEPTCNSRSDIDILILNSDENTPSIIKEACRIAKHDVSTNLFPKRKGELFIQYRNISIEVNPKIIQLRTGSLAEKPVPTLDPNLFLHISALYLSMRPGDRIGLMQYAREMRKNKDYLPEGLFKPFHALMDLKKERYPLDASIAKIQYFYLKNVPKPINYALEPILGKIKSIYINL